MWGQLIGVFVDVNQHNASSKTAEELASVSTAERREYLAELQQIEDLISDQTTSLDKTLITLSAGAFGLTIAFVTQVAPNPEAKWVMITAWSSFGLALCCTLLSFYVSIYALRREKLLRDKIYYPDQKGEVEDRNPFAHAVSILNGLAIVSFVAGVIALAIFAGRNTLGGS